MCGRYRRRSDKQRIVEAFEVGMGLEEIYFDPEDDIAPGSIQPVILTNDAGERAIAPMRWGFKLPDRHLFTARSETIDHARFWKESFQLRRCIIPADAIFEWAEVPRGKKPKYEITIPGREPFGIAGVWNLWKNPKNNDMEPTFAVLTGEPNELIKPIHHRMTTIVEPRDYSEYLSSTDRPPLHLLRILPPEAMEVTRVDSPEPEHKQLDLF